MIDVHRLVSSCPPSLTIAWARCSTCKAPLRSDGAGCTGHPQHSTAPTCQLYATHSNTGLNLAAMHAAGIRVLVGPDQLDRGTPDVPELAWACDNGAWGARHEPSKWSPEDFREVLARWGGGADWTVAPDIVAGGRDSLRLTEQWLPDVLGVCRLALVAVQDGMERADVASLLGPRVGLFIGGSTSWKWRTMPAWADLAREVPCYLHVGRVNSARGIAWCASHAVHSVDGTSATKWAVNAPLLGGAARAAKQPLLFHAGGAA